MGEAQLRDGILAKPTPCKGRIPIFSSMVELLAWAKLAQEVIAVRLVILLGFFLIVSWAFQVLREAAMVSYLEIPEKT